MSTSQKYAIHVKSSALTQELFWAMYEAIGTKEETSLRKAYKAALRADKVLFHAWIDSV